MKRYSLILILIFIPIIFISSNLFARSGGRSGGRSFSSRKSSSYSNSSTRSSGAKNYSSSSSTKRKGTGYYDPNYKKVGNYIEDDGSDFLFYIITAIIFGILWFIYKIAGGKKYLIKFSNKIFKKMDDITWSDESIISFSLLIDKLDIDLIETIYFFNEGMNVRIHKILPILIENSSKISKFGKIELKKGLKFDKTKEMVDKIKESHIQLTSNAPDGEIYLVSIVASFISKLNIEEKENYTIEEFNDILKEMLKLNKFIIIDNVKHSSVIIYKVKKQYFL